MVGYVQKPGHFTPLVFINKKPRQENQSIKYKVIQVSVANITNFYIKYLLLI